MISSKNLITDINNVPDYWVFEHYLNLPEALNGQTIQINSIFNPNDKTPSMCIYMDYFTFDNVTKKQYLYKDFSTGNFGDKIRLVSKLLSLPLPSAINKILKDYNNCKDKTVRKINKNLIQSKWICSDYKVREWTDKDARYWLKYNIGSNDLENHNIKALDYFTITKQEKERKIYSKLMYGFFNSKGELYKVYRPLSKKMKFYKFKSEIQNYDLLEYKEPYLVICSSLKDLITLKSFKYNVEAIAPESENSMIKPIIIYNLLKRYKKVITLFDNDDAGKKAVNKYKEIYNIDGFVMPLEKDISDAVAKHGVKSIKKMLIPYFKKVLYER